MKIHDCAQKAPRQTLRASKLEIRVELRIAGVSPEETFPSINKMLLKPRASLLLTTFCESRAGEPGCSGSVANRFLASRFLAQQCNGYSFPLE